MLRLVALVAVLVTGAGGPTRPSNGARHPADVARAVKVTVLSTMLAGDPGGGIGEWGYSALVEVDGQRILFDTGARPETVLRNAAELGIDLSTVTDVILSHNHGDHTGGLLALRQAMMQKNPAALSRVHVARGIFWSRTSKDGREQNGLLPNRVAFESLGGSFIEHDGPAELLPGVWFTGPVPRVYPERNWSGNYLLASPAGEVEDNIPEDASLVINTKDGLVLVSGCGHAGIINTVTYAKTIVPGATLYAAIGGFHLFAASDDRLTWTGEKLKEAGLVYLLGGHCTGIEAVFQIRQVSGLSRQNAVVSAVGSTFTLGKGIDALALAG